MTDDLDPQHERAVDEFLRAAADKQAGAALDDRGFRAWLKRHAHPVLTERELDWRRSHEVGFTQQFATTGVMSALGRPSISVVADIFGRRVMAPCF